MDRISTEILKSVLGLNLLSHEILAGLIRFGHLEHIRKQRVIGYQKDACGFCFCVIEGKVNKIKFMSDESSLKIGTSVQGEWVAVPEVIMKTDFLYDSVASVGSIILSFSAPDFVQLLKTCGFRDYILRIMSKELILLHRNIELNTPGARIIQLIKERVEVRPGFSNLLPMTQDEIAGETGTTRETVNRFLKNLEGMNIIRTGRGSLEITDLEALDGFE